MVASTYNNSSDWMEQVPEYRVSRQKKRPIWLSDCIVDSQRDETSSSSDEKDFSEEEFVVVNKPKRAKSFVESPYQELPEAEVDAGSGTREDEQNLDWALIRLDSPSHTHNDLGQAFSAASGSVETDGNIPEAEEAASMVRQPSLILKLPQVCHPRRNELTSCCCHYWVTSPKQSAQSKKFQAIYNHLSSSCKCWLEEAKAVWLV